MRKKKLRDLIKSLCALAAAFGCLYGYLWFATSSHDIVRSKKFTTIQNVTQQTTEDYAPWANH